MLLVGLDRFGIVHPRLDVVGGAHRGARTQERREARKAEPGFIPQEDQVGLDRQTLLHHPAGVVDVAVEGAVGQVHHLDPIQPVVGLQVQQRLLDGLERHRAIHRIFRHREGFDIERLRARQHHAVVMRFVAVAVDDHDIAGTDQRLHRHLVRRRRAVGDKEDVVGPEGARRLVLGLLDVAGRFQQAVETARGRAALGEEEVWTVEFAHVANPVRPEDGLAARDGERVERSDRALGIFLEIVEERRFEAILNAFQDGEMQLEQLFHRVEDAANDVGLGIAGQLLHVAVGDQIDVELGANALQRARQRQRRVGHLLAIHRCHQGAQHRRVMPGVQRKPFVDDDGRKVGIEHRGTECVLETADKDRLIDESIHRTAQLAPLGGKVGTSSWPGCR